MARRRRGVEEMSKRKANAIKRKESPKVCQLVLWVVFRSRSLSDLSPTCAHDPHPIVSFFVLLLVSAEKHRKGERAHWWGGAEMNLMMGGTLYESVRPHNKRLV